MTDFETAVAALRAAHNQDPKLSICQIIAFGRVTCIGPDSLQETSDADLVTMVRAAFQGEAPKRSALPTAAELSFDAFFAMLVPGKVVRREEEPEPASTSTEKDE